MLSECGSCGTRYAPDLQACPHCGAPAAAGDDGQGDGEDEEADVAKISRSAGVTFPREPEPVPPGMGEEDPEGSHAGDEDGAEPAVPQAGEAPVPAPAPRTPPRRANPAAQAPP